MRGFYFARKMENGQPNEMGELAYPDAELPEYQTKHSAGADFFCAEEVTVPSIWSNIPNLFETGGFGSLWHKPKNDIEETCFCPTLVHTGIKASMYDDEALFLYNRSSGPMKKGLVLANSVGVIDKDYFNNPDNDGEIRFAFYNFFPWPVTLKVGDRIGQGVFKKVLRPEEGLRVKDVDRVGGHGSTGN